MQVYNLNFDYVNFKIKTNKKKLKKLNRIYLNRIYLKLEPLKLQPNSVRIIQNMARCCNPIISEFAPSYAGVLVAGGVDRMEAAVKELEAGHIRPCITAWCSHCQAPYLITASMGLFKSPSEHHAHMLTLAKSSKDRMK